MVSVPVVPKLNPNHVGIGSRTERLRVLKRRKLKNYLRFSFLLLVTRWSYRKFEHDGFARVIDERFVTEMISCYPNVTDPECACCWKFTLR